MARYGKGYENPDDAAAAALMLLARQPRAAEQEYMGLLVRDPETGLVYRTDFQTQGNRDTSSWTGYPEGDIAGIAHNHPAQRPGDRYPMTHFSPQDVNTAIGSEAPSYIAAVEKPGRAKDRKYMPRGGHRDRAMKGKDFLAQFPINELLQHLALRNPLVASYLAERSTNPMVAANGNSNSR